MNSIRHLYVHIPFCPSICPYCSFHVLRANKTQAERFLESLLMEFRSIANDLDAATVFLGGGTPTALSTEMLQTLLSVVLNGKHGLEVTIECNPSTLSRQKAAALLALGINRLSIGAQSFDPPVLQTLGRAHTVAAIHQCVATAREDGFANINLDLIFGVPVQTLESWRNTLLEAIALQPQHLSCYALTYEEDTDFFLRHQRGELRDTPDLEAEMFRLADEILAGAGYHHYEISNYALPGFECRHNLAYWRGEDYHGIGPSAVSTVCGERRRNSRMNERGAWEAEEVERLSVQTLAAERMALGLRTSEGIEETSFAEKFGFSPSEHWPREIAFLEQTRLMTIQSRSRPVSQRNFRLSNRGRAVADEVASYFV